MRHNKAINHLGRKSGHRKALLANMATSLILHKRINTTVAKAKALRMYVEPLISKSKEDTTHSRRMVFSYLKNKYAVTELFRVVAPKIADRPGGYTRILKTGFSSSSLTSTRQLSLRLLRKRPRRAAHAAAAQRRLLLRQPRRQHRQHRLQKLLLRPLMPRLQKPLQQRLLQQKHLQKRRRLSNQRKEDLRVLFSAVS